jgi:hypothetical protein
MIHRFGIVFAVSLLATPAATYAQQFGEITGTVTDATGASVAGSTITVTNTATQQVRTAPSNATGNFDIPFLLPGNYKVRAAKSGFKVATQSNVDIQVGGVARIDFKMEVGELSQQVEITAAAPLLNTESVALGNVIETKQIVDLPLNGRDYLNLVELNPDTVVGQVPATGSSGLQGGLRASESISIAGQRLEYNHYTLDGIENTDPNFNSYIMHPSVDAIQEFKVLTGIYSAEFGRGASQINATTISGTNAYHGAAFEFLRNSDADAAAWRQVGAKNPYRRNDFGFTLGGPVSIPKLFSGKDRLFFMSNFEGLKIRTTTQQAASVMTLAMRQGDFSQTPNVLPLYDPATRVTGPNGQQTASPFAGNIIPMSRLNPAAAALMQYYPLPTVSGNSLAGNGLGNYVFQDPQPTNSVQFNQRIDWNESSKSTWFGRFSWENDDSVPPSVFLDNSSVTRTTTRQAVLANTRTITPTIVNDARFAWNQFNNDLVGYYANNTDVQNTLNINGLTAPSPLAYGLPAIGIGGGLSFPGGVTPWVTRDDTFQWLESLSMVRGSHTIRIGGEIRRNRYNQWGNQKATGEFDFDGLSTANPAASTATGYAPADFFIGLPSQAYRVVGMASAQMRSDFYSTYVQDDWKVTSRLTLNIGLRYENQRPWIDKHNALINAQVFTEGVGPNGVVPNAPVPIICRPGNQPFYQGFNFRFAQPQQVETGCGVGGRNVVRPDNMNFGPRIGLAYSPEEKWSIRAGFGIFYVQDIGNVVFDMARNTGGKDGNIIPGTIRNTVLNDPWATETASPLCPGYSGVCLNAPQIQANYQGNRTPYVEQYMFNIQHQLTHNLMLEVGYLGNEGHHLDRFVEFNQAVPKTGSTDTSSVNSRRPFQGYGPIQEVAGLDNSNYNSLSARLTQRLTRGLSYLVGFTWSKAIDEGSGLRTNGSDPLWPDNSYNLKLMRGLAEFDVPRRLVASFNYELPFGTGKQWLSQGVMSYVAGGWNIGGIYTVADGYPVNAYQVGDTAGLGVLNNQIDATGISPIPANRTAQNYWNIAAFDATNPNLAWQPGNMGRNTLFAPGVQVLDTSLYKAFRIRESQTLQVRIEAFNTLNHPNWNPPSSNPLVPSTFGVITSAGLMREMQFALKYVF